MRKTISLDFDGVLHDHSAGWTGYAPEGRPVEGARAFVDECLAEGLTVIISSCRAYTQIGREGIRGWLEQHGFPAHRLSITCEKPYAEWYVDDRSVRFEGCFAAVREQMARAPWLDPGDNPTFEGG